MPKLPLTAIVHTRNEEANIRRCLAALDWVHDVIVVDSGSVDDTVAIAKEFGVRTYVRECTRKGLVDQRNWALDHVPLETEWVVIVDADEVFPEPLVDEIGRVLSKSDAIDGMWVRFQNIFLGRWIKHASMYPSWTLRVFRHRVVRYEKRQVNAHPALDPDREWFLKEHFLHEDLKGIDAWIRRIPEFARLESAEYKKNCSGLGGTVPIREAFRSRSLRRRWLKNTFMKLPARPFMLFTYLYVIRRGFLDGYPGLAFCALKAIQEVYVNMYLFEEKYRPGNTSSVG